MKGVTLCFPKGGIKGDHVFLLTPAQINRLDKAQVQGKCVQIRLSARQVAKNANYTGGFIMSLVRALLMHYLQFCRDLQLVCFLVVLTR